MSSWTFKVFLSVDLVARKLFEFSKYVVMVTLVMPDIGISSISSKLRGLVYKTCY